MKAFSLGLIVALGTCILSSQLSPRDDSDGKKRSGLKVRTDALTGIQYLETIGGGITPRLNRDGSVIMIKGEAQ
jgi:hypothetical protein